MPAANGLSHLEQVGSKPWVLHAGIGTSPWAPGGVVFPVPPYFPVIRNSVRRFRARPAALLLSAMGRVGP